MATGGLTPPQIEALLEGPALVAPPGQTYNFINPENSSYNWYIFTLTICFGVSTFAVLIRIYTRVKIIKIHGFEDYFCVAGWLLFIAYAVTTSYVVHYGGGVHQWNVQLKNAIQVTFWTYLTELVYGCTILCLKTSILIQYRKVFLPSKKSDMMFWGTHSLNAIIILYYVAIDFVVAFQCDPVKRAWDPLIEGRRCLSNDQINISSGYFNAITDFAILLLPQRVIWTLQMPWRKRAAVSGIFLVGLFACVSSILRLIFSYNVKNTEDVTYEIVLLGFWSYGELASCIICACLPMFPKFIQHTTNKWKKSGSTNFSYLSWRSLQSWSFGRTRVSPTNPMTTNTAADTSFPSQESFKAPYYELDEHELLERSQKTSQWPESGEPPVAIIH